MKKQMKKQMLSLVVSAAMTASMMPKPALAADNTTFPDMPNDWSTQALQNAINNGLLNGIDGKIAAGENLTRAQMAAIVTRAFGTNGKADISSFGDVNTGDWFYDAMASSVLMGAIQGDGVNLNPNANITRQEAFTVLARLFTLSGGDQSVLNSYTDGAQVADWAKDSMASMVAAGYVKGSDNKLNPTSSITRAEFAQVMDNLVKTYFADSQLNVNANGNAVLNKAGTLEGATISGDLIIGDGAAEGDVVLKDVTVSGRLLVRGGGTSTVTLEGNTTVGSVVVNKPTGAVRVENNTEKTVNVNAVSDNVVLTGDFNEVNANAAQGTVTLTGATVATMNVAGTSAKVVVSEKSTVETMNVQGSASGAAVSVQSGTTVKTMNTAASKAVVTVNGTVGTMSVSGSDTTVKAEEGAKIEKVTTSAANTTVSGEGSVTNFEAAQGSSGASITTSGTKVVNNGTGNVTTGNDKVIASGSTGTSESDNTGTTTPGGGGSTGGEDEGTPILPVGGVGVANLVDKDGDGAVTDIATNYSVNATQTVGQDYVNVAITASNVKYHTNANSMDGYWVGFSVVAPEGATKFKVGFANTQQGAEEALKADVDGSVLMPNIDGTATDGVGKQGIAVYSSATADSPKTWVKLQWVNAKGENVGDATLYKMDLSNVTVAPIDNIDDLESVLPENTYGEAYNISNVTLAGEVALSKALSVPTGKTLTVAKDSTLTVDETNKLTVAAGATVVVNGTVTGTYVEGKDTTSKLVIAEGGSYNDMSAGEYVWDVETSKWVKAPATEGDTLPSTADWKFISSYTLTGAVTLKEGTYEVPADKTLVIAESGTLDAYNVALSGAGSVVVQGGTLKINANYNGGPDSKLPTIATIQVNHGGTLASMTTKVGAAEADTKFVGPDANARIQTTEGASVTFKLGSLGEGSKPTMIISGDVIIPEGQTWYSMFDSEGGAIGIDMTLEKGTMTVAGTLRITSADGSGSSLTINEDASVVVNGEMSVAGKGSVTGKSGSVTGAENATLKITKGATVSAIAGVTSDKTGTYTWSTESSIWTTGA